MEEKAFSRKCSASSKSFWNTVYFFIKGKETLLNNDNIFEAPNDTGLTVKRGNLVFIKSRDEIRDE